MGDKENNFCKRTKKKIRESSSVITVLGHKNCFIPNMGSGEKEKQLALLDCMIGELKWVV